MRIFYKPVVSLFAPPAPKVPDLPSAADDAGAEQKAAEGARRKALAAAQGATGRSSLLTPGASGTAQSGLKTGRTTLLGVS